MYKKNVCNILEYCITSLYTFFMTKLFVNLLKGNRLTFILILKIIIEHYCLNILMF